MGQHTEKADEWQVVAASVRGTSHQKSNLPCQDVVAFRCLPNGVLVAALADGAGSASMAEVGATVAAQSAIESLSAAFGSASPPGGDEELRAALLNALSGARASVVAEAERRSVRARELATTLIVAAFMRTRAVSAQIGDGAVVVSIQPGTFDLLTGPPQTEHLNETIFLTADAALDHAQVKVLSGHVRYVALLCDGLQLLALKYPELVPHAGFFGPLFGFLEKARPGEETAARLREFLESPRVTARSDDDLSLVLAVLREQTVP